MESDAAHAYAWGMRILCSGGFTEEERDRAHAHARLILGSHVQDVICVDLISQPDGGGYAVSARATMVSGTRIEHRARHRHRGDAVELVMRAVRREIGSRGRVFSRILGAQLR